MGGRTGLSMVWDTPAPDAIHRLDIGPRGAPAACARTGQARSCALVVVERPSRSDRRYALDSGHAANVGALAVTSARVGEGTSAETMRRFGEVALPHADAAYNLARRLTRGSDAAEDIVQDAFVRALAGFGAFWGGDARAWLLTIVRNRFYDWLRERRRGATAPLAMAGAFDEGGEDAAQDYTDLDADTPETELLRKDQAMSMRALIDRLPTRLREVLVLREMEDLSYREIAEITGSPIGSVMSRLARARAALGDAWRAWEQEVAGAGT
jgi:RNA polymerase sigma-70 factor (ECF subfamily)